MPQTGNLLCLHFPDAVQIALQFGKDRRCADDHGQNPEQAGQRALFWFLRARQHAFNCPGAIFSEHPPACSMMPAWAASCPNTNPATAITITSSGAMENTV